MLKPRRRSARIAGSFVLTAALLACARGGAETGSSIEPSELAAQISAGTAPVILDVRTPEEFASGHIPGAVNIPIDQLEGRLATAGLPRSDEIVVHCERGPRAAKAEAILEASGYADVRDLSGHMQAWRAAGLPVE